MSERINFIARLNDGERMTDLCKEYGISRTLGHRLKKRYETIGAAALENGSRRPHSSPNRTKRVLVERVIELRDKYPTWGPKKLKARLAVLDPESRWPAASTIGAILKDAGKSKPRRRRRTAFVTPKSELVTSCAPNELWAIDFKGQFRLGDDSLCYPLTVTDHFSRFLVGCEALKSTKTEPSLRTMMALFDKYGLPDRIRSDNGSPFASTGIAGLTRFSVQLLRLGIKLERIKPGHPEQNGRHERMHRTLKAETTRPAAKNMWEQQDTFDDFVRIFNTERPHEAINMKTPIDLFTHSERRVHKLEPLTYPLHDDRKRVAKNGAFRFERKELFLGRALAGQNVGLKQVEDHTWLISFMDIDLAYLDAVEKLVLPFSKPE